MMVDPGMRLAPVSLAADSPEPLTSSAAPALRTAAEQLPQPDP
jgi:hypothetical protein